MWKLGAIQTSVLKVLSDSLARELPLTRGLACLALMSNVWSQLLLKFKEISDANRYFHELKQ